MSRNGNCDAKHHGNASAGTMVRLQLVFHGQGKQKQSTKHTKKRPNKGWSRTRSERGPNEVPNEVKNYPGQTLTQILELEDFRLQLAVVVEYAQPKTKKTNTELSKERVEYAHPKTKKTNTKNLEKKEHRMAHTHPRAKTTYMTNPKCLNVIHQNTSLYILFHAILSYLNLTNPHKHICCENKATHGRHTSKHRNNIHSLSNMLYYDAPQYAFPQGRRSSATT